MLNRSARSHEGVDRTAKILRYVLEAHHRTRCIPHAAVVKPECGNPPRSEVPREHHELPVTTHAILWTTDHDNHANRPGQVSRGGYANQILTLA
jgi:hypothetical protein